MVESGWLIEIVMGGRAWWWMADNGCGRQWTTDANEAIRFARKLDAERLIQRLGSTRVDFRGAYATDHMWIPSGAV